jgi:hypothetical protein
MMPRMTALVPTGRSTAALASNRSGEVALPFDPFGSGEARATVARPSGSRLNCLVADWLMAIPFINMSGAMVSRRLVRKHIAHNCVFTVLHQVVKLPEAMQRFRKTAFG